MSHHSAPPTKPRRAKSRKAKSVHTRRVTYKANPKAIPDVAQYKDVPLDKPKRLHTPPWLRKPKPVTRKRPKRRKNVKCDDCEYLRQIQKFEKEKLRLKRPKVKPLEIMPSRLIYKPEARPTLTGQVNQLFQQQLLQAFNNYQQGKPLVLPGTLPPPPVVATPVPPVPPPPPPATSNAPRPPSATPEEKKGGPVTELMVRATANPKLPKASDLQNFLDSMGYSRGPRHVLIVQWMAKNGFDSDSYVQGLAKLQRYVNDFITTGQQQGYGSKFGKPIPPLFTSQLDSIMDSWRDKGFAGTVARDEIKDLLPFARKNRKGQMGFIVNTARVNDPEGSVQEHWIACAIRPNNQKEVNWYDPLGEPVPEDMLKDVQDLAQTMQPKYLLKLKQNLIPHQAGNTSSCGVHSCVALQKLLDGEEWKRVTAFDGIQKEEREMKEKYKDWVKFGYI